MTRSATVVFVALSFAFKRPFFVNPKVIFSFLSFSFISTSFFDSSVTILTHAAVGFNHVGPHPALAPLELKCICPPARCVPPAAPCNC